MNGAARTALIGLVAGGMFALLLFFSGAGAVESDDMRKWLGVIVASSTAGVALLAISTWLNRRCAAMRTVPVVVVESIVIGTLVALVYLDLAATLGIDTGDDPALYVLLLAVVTAVAGFAASVLQRVRSRERERRRALLDEGIALAEAREQTSGMLQYMRATLEADIEAALSPARIGIEERLALRERELGDEDWGEIASQLRATAEEMVRPLSRQLWSRSTSNLPPLTMRRILRSIVSQQPFQPLTLAILYLITSMISSVTMFGWAIGVAVLAAGLCLIFAVLGGTNLLMRHHPNRHSLLFIAGALGLQATGLLNFPVRARLGAVPYTWAEFIAASVLGIVFIFATSGFGSVRTYRADLERTLQADLDRELLTSMAASREVAQLARESARILHGSVQSRLISCAVAIELASDVQDVEAFESALRQAHAVLVTPAWKSAESATTVLTEVERKMGLWAGLCDISLRMDPDIADLSGSPARAAGRVVEEGLANAISHGDAGAISLVVTRAGSMLCVEVLDDGCGPTGGGPGLGSALLDTSTTRWSLDHGPDGRGARLRAEISLDRSQPNH